ncbi:MAG TPA: hypothetical protein VLH38_04135 [Patescibacteria group bacterium]|nr:hypothetical protein [Patescibacteria group bacterium]
MTKQQKTIDDGKASTNAIVGGLAPKRRRRMFLLLGIIAVVIVIAVAAGMYWFFIRDTTAKKGPEAQRIESSIAAQEQLLSETTKEPNDAQAIAYGNLAQSYAYVKQCDKANDALRRAKQLAPEVLRQSIQLTEKYVRGYCK